MQTFAEEAFYVYAYDRPASPWVYVWAGLAAVGALALCLFPLAPDWVGAAEGVCVGGWVGWGG